MPAKLSQETEAGFLRAVIQLARLHGWRCVHFDAGRGRSGKWVTPYLGDGRGFPDLVCLRGAAVFVAELKIGKNKCTGEQAAWLTAFADAGVPAYRWYPADWAEIERVLRDGPEPVTVAGGLSMATAGEVLAKHQREAIWRP